MRDAEIEADVATLEWVISCIGNLDRFREGKAALARLEQTIDGLRRERSSLVAAAERTEAIRNERDEALAAAHHLHHRAVAAEAERDAALGACTIAQNAAVYDREDAAKMQRERDAALADAAENRAYWQAEREAKESALARVEALEVELRGSS